VLSEADENLKDNFRKFEEKIWDLLIEYTQNPGNVVQNIRKLPELCRTGKINQSKR
jgi:protein involved in sex pheromone biosynthesis